MISSRSIFLPALLGLATQLSAQGLFLDGPIEARVVYDTVRGRPVALGTDGGTWEWQGAQRLHRTAEGPGQRTGAAMVFDRARNQVVLFGGSVPNVGNALGDTWTWDGTAWSQPFQLLPPPRRIDACMAYDTARQRAVLFGGRDPNVTVPNDVWEYDGYQWQRVPFLPPGPNATNQPTAMAYDPVRGEVVIVLMTSTSPQAWSWDGARWALVASGGPTATLGTGMAFDQVRSRLVLLASATGGGQIWELQGSFWSLGPLVPGLRVDQSSLYLDPSRSAIVIQGGRFTNATPANVTANTSTWTYDGVTALQIAPAHSPDRRGGFAAAYDPLRARSILFGGGPAGSERNDLWEWDGVSWSPRVLTPLPSVRERAVACFDGARSAVLLFGGRAGSALSNETWALDGTGWTQLQPATAPAACHSAAMAWDPVRGRAVLFGGNNGSTPNNATWEWDGVTWLQHNPTTAPTARYEHSMAYDSARNRVVLYGGRSSSTLSFTDTWTWDGFLWQQVATAQNPGVSSGAGMAFDPLASAIALARTVTTGQITRGELWHFDGTNWALFGSAPTRELGTRALLHDTGRDRLLLLDGEQVSERTLTPASLALFGQGCGAPPPRILGHSRPRIGQTTFGAELWTGPTLPLVWIAGWNAVNTSLGNGCTLLVQPVATTFAIADAQGYSLFPLPVPATAGLRGLTVQFQGAVLDPAAPGGFALSAGLRALVGD